MPGKSMRDNDRSRGERGSLRSPTFGVEVVLLIILALLFISALFQ